MTRVLIVKHTTNKVAGWAGLAFSTFVAVKSWGEVGRGSSLVFLAFVALGVYLILTTGSMTVDSNCIRYYLPLRSYKIRWNEVRYIEFDRHGHTMVVFGENKRLAMYGPSTWFGKDKVDTYKFMAEQIEKYGIEVRQTEKAMFRFSRNTQVDRRLG